VHYLFVATCTCAQNLRQISLKSTPALGFRTVAERFNELAFFRHNRMGQCKGGGSLCGSENFSLECVVRDLTDTRGPGFPSLNLIESHNAVR
jgi:hypothetical protein